MTGPELRAALVELGLTQRDFATRFGLSFVAVNRWIMQRRRVPTWVPPVLDLIRRENGADAALAAHRKQGRS